MVAAVGDLYDISAPAMDFCQSFGVKRQEVVQSNLFDPKKLKSHLGNRAQCGVAVTIDGSAPIILVWASPLKVFDFETTQGGMWKLLKKAYLKNSNGFNSDLDFQCYANLTDNSLFSIDLFKLPYSQLLYSGYEADNMLFRSSINGPRMFK